MNHWLLLGTAGALVGEAFFSGSEMTLLNTNPAQIYRRARKASGAPGLMGYYKSPDYWLAVTVLGTNLCVVSGAFCAERWASGGPEWLVPATGALNVLAVLFFARYSQVPVAARRDRVGAGRDACPHGAPVSAAPLGLLLRLVTKAIRKSKGARAEKGTTGLREDLTHVLSDRLRHADSMRLLAEGVLSKLHAPASDLMVPLALAPTLPFPATHKTWRGCWTVERGTWPGSWTGRAGSSPWPAPGTSCPSLRKAPLPTDGPSVPRRPLPELLSEALDAMKRARADWAVLKSGERSVGYILLEDLPVRLMQA